ncbi:MAG TPA: VOC family protein [Thermoanaerobaculia bacterium]|nr:VOC family protein [Thermoanaerobaculia bacterium]
MFKKLTPVLVVDAIEPVLPFWTALGFKATVEVPHAGRVGFVILKAGEVEIMYQTVASIREDEGSVLEGPRPIGAAAVYIEVGDLRKIALPAGTDVIAAGRTTFYGATETIVRDPAGNVITFAQMKE